MKKPKISEEERLFELTKYEREYWQQGINVAGMDEVGRGPLAGPVAVGCVIMPPSPLIEGVNDSKKLTEARREKLAPLIKDAAIAYRIEFASPELIDELNISEAIKMIFEKAFNGLEAECDHVLIDYVKGLNIHAHQIPLVHGDALSYSIGAASIIAKTERDAYMRKMHEKYPQYNFASNKGYGTAEHIAALHKYGPCPIHRRSFIKKILANEHE